MKILYRVSLWLLMLEVERNVGVALEKYLVWSVKEWGRRWASVSALKMSFPLRLWNIYERNEPFNVICDNR